MEVDQVREPFGTVELTVGIPSIRSFIQCNNAYAVSCLVLPLPQATPIINMN